MKVTVATAIWLLAPSLLLWAGVAFVQMDAAWLLHATPDERFGFLVACGIATGFSFPVFLCLLEAVDP
jgi:hypothetical protein